MFVVHFKASIDIDASAERVWEVLTDFKRYPEWNPFTPQVITEGEIGQAVDLYVQMRPDQKPMIHKAKISQRVENERIAWQYVLPGLLTAERIQWLTPLEDGRVRYECDDCNAGLLAPLVGRIYGKRITEGFEKVAAALKSQAEI